MNALLEKATQIFQDVLGDHIQHLDEETITQALSDVVPGLAQADLSQLLERFQQGGLLEMAGSLLGSAQSLSVDQIKNAIGPEAIEAFSSRLGLDEQTAVGGLSEVVSRLSTQGKDFAGDLMGSAGSVLGKFLK